MSRRLQNTVVGVVVGLATFLAGNGTVCACSCGGLTDAEALRQSTAVFVGTLREVRGPTVQFSSGAPSRFIFEVDAAYKGAVHEVQSIVSSSDGASCGLEIDVGERAVVFATASGSADLESGEYAAGLCDGTRSFGAVGLPDNLGPTVGLVDGTSPIGEDDSYPSVIVRNWYWVVAGIVVVIVTGVALRRRRASPRPS